MKTLEEVIQSRLAELQADVTTMVTAVNMGGNTEHTIMGIASRIKSHNAKIIELQFVLSLHEQLK